ncbi:MULTISPECIES: type 4a pilus biogenesis protein PilO [unclassified Neisseria]|uniref:type 4a pilus biogenesis protein PilO n=1 Tax=unclassified Neisseria TaxID=2623750 RepID=UPI002665BA00|nr:MULTISPECIES: type 4a pilus biogenesis protein PilO [unclassified Neisseria]MDO1509910.1 type 4a pilus biogenesis protein PilO [Neisseria sp. MVDL19-042950]MDO1516109.1 type 4a pilus biogenesis protein PilO [Neisseria sp. MVDL18-041461]MDO1563224.1 type 4a pilus biogenesis protein PilO [Neisseria sp. MVDL20-010259]
MSVKKLKDIDIHTLHLLSTPAKLTLAGLTIVGVLAISYFALFRMQIETLDSVQNKEIELKDTYTKKSIEAANLDNLKAELSAIRSSFNVLLKQLPTDAEIPNLIQELHQAGATNGLRMDSVTPQTSINEGPIQVLPYEISITGKYNQISQFTRDVGALSRIITLESLKIGHKDDKNSNQLTFSATANTYKARPVEEVEAEIAAASAAEKAQSNQ